MLLFAALSTEGIPAAVSPFHMIASLVAITGGDSLDLDPEFRAAQEHYVRRSALESHEKAADAFFEVGKKHPESLEAQVWCARTAYYAAHRLRDDKKRMRRVAALGQACGERLLARFKGEYQAEIWAVLARFRSASASSWLPPLGEIERIAKQLEALRAGSPGEHLPYMLLGALYRELPGWPLSIGDKKKSFELLTAGLKLVPNDAEMLLQMAETQRALGDKPRAVATFRLCIEKGTGPAELSWETQDARDWAKKVLSEIE